jgi:hypothetical protein
VARQAGRTVGVSPGTKILNDKLYSQFVLMELNWSLIQFFRFSFCQLFYALFD